MPEIISLKHSDTDEEFDTDIFDIEPIVSEPRQVEDIIEIDFTFPGFSMSEKMEFVVKKKGLAFHEIGISKCGWLSESGKPLLPSFGRYLQIPPGKAFQYDIQRGPAIVFDNILITPSQGKVADDEMEYEFEFDEETYLRDEFYPPENVKVSGPFILDGYYALLINVMPLQYNPAQKKLIGYNSITVRIRLSGSLDISKDESVIVDERIDRKAFGNLFINPKRFKYAPFSSDPASIKEVSSGPEFLIIHAQDFKNAAAKLAEWKNMRGLYTEIIAKDEIGDSVSEIKDYIRGKRGKRFSKLRYVLLFGDINSIPTEEVNGNCTDHYYFTPKDPENPLEYIFSWISGGRIPVQNEEKAMAIVDQIIKYEKDPPADPQYYRNIVLAAYFQDNFPQDGRADRAYLETIERIREHLANLGLNVERIYVTNNQDPMYYKDGTPIPDEVKKIIVDKVTATKMLIEFANQGQLIFAHRDHGNPYGWIDPAFRTTDLDSITNTAPSLFYSINCHTGRFDLCDQAECFAEAILAKNGASPSLIAATRASGTWRNDSLIKAMFDAIYPGIIPTFPGSTASYGIQNNRLGDILNYSLSYLPIAHSGDDSGIKSHTEIYHVIGDPTLELWTSAPVPITMDIRVLKGFYLLISLSACPKDAFLSFWIDKKMLKGLRPGSTIIKIPFLKKVKLHVAEILKDIPPERRFLSICLFAPGHRFTKVNIGIANLI